MSDIPDYVQVVIARLAGEDKDDDRIFYRMSDSMWTDGAGGGVYGVEELVEVRL